MQTHVESKEDSRLRPHMTEGEVECFRRHLSNASTLLEFGCGGSTYLAVNAGLKKIWSVESDSGWIEKLKQEEPIRAAIQDGRLHLIHSNVGKTGAWGRVDEQGDRSTWHRYHSDVWRGLDAAALDLVLVDGRFRVACALQAVLRVRLDCPILIHDFWNRSKYHVVLDFLSVAEQVDSLGVFRVTEPRDIGKLVDALFAFMHRQQ